VVRGEGEHTCACRNHHADVGVDQGLAPRGDGGLARGVQVVAGGESAAARGHTRLVGELLDQERRRLVDLGDGDGRTAVCGGVGHCVGGVGLHALCGRGVWRGRDGDADGGIGGHVGEKTGAKLRTRYYQPRGRE